jgi:carboxymethylenebutenolidase
MIVRSEFRDLDTPTGPMRTYVYTPVHPTVARKYAGLILYPEIFQQTAPIARLCVQLASHGYVVMAPEIYHEHEPLGTVLGYDDAGKEKGNRYKQATKVSTFDNDAKALVRALKQHPACSGRIGTVGFCIGGHLAVRAALLPDILGCASFFPTDLHTGTLGEGKNADTLARIRETRAELARVQRAARVHARRRGALRRGSGATGHGARIGAVRAVLVTISSSATSRARPRPRDRRSGCSRASGSSGSRPARP